MGIIRETITDVQFVYKSTFSASAGALAYLVKGDPKTMILYAGVAGIYAHITAQKAQWHYERYPRWLKLQAQMKSGGKSGAPGEDISDEQKLKSLRFEEERQEKGLNIYGEKDESSLGEGLNGRSK